MTASPADAVPTAAARASAAVEKVLARYRNLTLDTLASEIPGEGPPYLYDLAAEYPRRPSKGLRPALCLAVGSAFGGNVDRMLGVAVAVELFHNAFLVHDDIQDGSELRRGAPTLSAQFGVAVALNVGNVTNLIGLQQVMSCRRTLGDHRAWQLCEETELMLRHSLEGQAIEIGWIRDNVCDLRADDYFRMCLKKTSWYTFLYPCRAGLIASGDAGDIARLDKFGWYLGAAFQIQDDLLNLVGDRDRYGKEIGGDLWEGKRTLMLISLLERCSAAERARVVRFLSRTRGERDAGDEGEVRWMLEQMTAYECLDSARAAAHDLAAAALREVEAVLEGRGGVSGGGVSGSGGGDGSGDDAIDDDDREFLLGLPRFVVARDR